jgi:hypothetical protein
MESTVREDCKTALEAIEKPLVVEQTRLKEQVKKFEASKAQADSFFGLLAREKKDCETAAETFKSHVDKTLESQATETKRLLAEERQKSLSEPAAQKRRFDQAFQDQPGRVHEKTVEGGEGSAQNPETIHEDSTSPEYKHYYDKHQYDLGVVTYRIIPHKKRLLR